MNREVNNHKEEKLLKRENRYILSRFGVKDEETYDIGQTPNIESSQSPNEFLNILQQITSQKWYISITLVISKQIIIPDLVAKVDIGADLNCIREGIVPSIHIVKTAQRGASGNKLEVNYELPEAYICQNDICIPTPFVLVKKFDPTCYIRDTILA